MGGDLMEGERKAYEAGCRAACRLGIARGRAYSEDDGAMEVIRELEIMLERARA